MVKQHLLFKPEPSRLQPLLLRRIPHVSALLIVGILAILAFDLWQSHARIIADGERTTSNLAQVLEEQTARTIQAIDLSLLSIDDAISLVDPDDSEHTENINQLLRQKLTTLPYVRAIFVIGTDGFITYDTDGDRPPVAQLQQPHPQYRSAATATDRRAYRAGHPARQRPGADPGRRLPG